MFFFTSICWGITNLAKLSILSTYVIDLNYWNLNFLFLVSMICSLYNIFNSCKLSLILGFSSFYYLVTMSFFSTYLVIKKLQTILWIGTIICHPPILYLLIGWLMFFCTVSFFDKFKYTFISTTLLTYLGVLTLFLGGLWGLQSLTWGFFWVNDSIEWLLLFFLLYALILHHFIPYIKKQLYSYFILLLLLTILFYIRLNFFNTRHSFFNIYWLNITYFNVYILIFCYWWTYILRLKFGVVIVVIYTYSLILYSFFFYLKISILIVFIYLTNNLFFLIYSKPLLNLHKIISISIILWIYWLNNFVIYYLNVNTYLGGLCVYFKGSIINLNYLLISTDISTVLDKTIALNNDNFFNLLALFNNNAYLTYLDNISLFYVVIYYVHWFSYRKYQNFE